MFKALKSWFSALPTVAKVAVVSGIVLSSGIANSALVSNVQTKNTNLQPAPAQATVSVKAPCQPSKTTSTENAPIPFDKTTLQDPNTAKGKSYLKTAGVEGVKTLTYDVVTYSPVGCNSDQKNLVKEEITTAPVTEVTAVGTYVAPAVAQAAPVKLSRTGICHAPGSTYYERTIYYTPYNTLAECLQHGRLPKR